MITQIMNNYSHTAQLAEDIDIGEECPQPTTPSTTAKKNSSSNHRPSTFKVPSASTKPVPQEAEVTDLRELTKLLNNTSALLQRNSKKS